jgi:hypothetical protein
MIKFRQPSLRGTPAQRTLLGAFALALSLPTLADSATPAPVPAALAAPTSATVSSTLTTSTAPGSTATAPAPVAPKAPEPPRVRVVYLNDSDRARILAELKQEVLQTAKDDNWAQPNTFPDWVSRVRFSGDITFRGEADMYDKANSDEVLNFQQLNSKGPTNIAPPASGQPLTLPFLNTRENRYVPRLRVHIGMFAQVADNMEAIFRFATGNSTNPGSATSTLGSDFAKQSFLFDRAYMNYRPTTSTAVAMGRMGNPFATPTDMVWSKELAFDGLALQFHSEPHHHTSLIATGGMFSVLSTDPNFPANGIVKSGNHGDWLYAGQLGIDWQGDSGTDARAAMALYNFDNIETPLSTPCYAPTTAVGCSTDNTVPAFMQKGNTLMASRDLLLVNSTDAQYQYFGLASKFRVLDVTGSLDTIYAGPIHLGFDIDYVKNLAFKRAEISAQSPVTNLGACPASNGSCVAPYVGGGTGEQYQLRVGYPRISERGQWSALLGYRYLQSDAVVDAFNDQDFHLGGTNAKGYFIGGSLGFTHNAWVSARYLSATEISGPPLAIDVLQLDVNARF